MSWARTATFHEQLAVTLDAGIGIAQAVPLAGDTAGGTLRLSAAQWGNGCAGGRGLAEQMATSHPPFDVALIRAGERSGRLPELCRELAAHYRHKIALRTLIIGRLIYPVMLIHAALLTAGIVLTFLLAWSPWIILALPLLLWSGVVAVVMGVRLLGPELRARIVLRGPFAPLTMPLVSANTCTVLRAALTAGLMGPDALELTAGACGNPVVATRLQTAARDLRHNRLESITAALARAGLPSLVIDHVRSGEISGKLDQNLGQAATLMRESFRLRSEWTARVACGVIYGGALLVGAAVVFLWMASYLGMINDVMKDQSALPHQIRKYLFG